MRNVLIIGMPASGKSTYIAALRHQLLAGEIDAELELSMLSDSGAQHLDRLEERWLSCEEVDRTKTATEKWVELRVRNRATSEETVLLLPDLRGEAFEAPVVNALLRQDIFDALIDSSGCLLFTNADSPDDALLIDDLADIFDDETNEADAAADVEAEIVEEGGDVAETTDPVPAAPEPVLKPFDPKDMPEETKVAELLQLANRRPQKPKFRKVAIIISAWDQGALAGLTPEAWLAEKRPMLFQFLKYHGELWDSRVYGVSAQGGPLPAKKKELGDHKKPSERVTVIGDNASPHDLSAPIQWLMSSQ